MDEAIYLTEASFFYDATSKVPFCSPISGVLNPGGAVLARSERTFPAYVSMARLAR